MKYHSNLNNTYLLTDKTTLFLLKSLEHLVLRKKLFKKKKIKNMNNLQRKLSPFNESVSNSSPTLMSETHFWK